MENAFCYMFVRENVSRGEEKVTFISLTKYNVLLSLKRLILEKTVNNL